MTTLTELELVALRERFPALQRPGPDGRPLVYLDGAAGSQVPREVAEAMSGQLLAGTANTGGAYDTSRDAEVLVDAARRVAAELTGADPDEIAFGASTTALQFQLAHAVARTLRPGDEIVTTALDHDANVAPWLRVAEDHDLVVKVAPMNAADGTVHPDAVAGLVGSRTRIVAYTLASNALGTIPDAAGLAALAHQVGALAWADGVHFMPHRRVAGVRHGADVLVCSAGKFFGPHVGIAAIRRDLAESWPADRVRPAGQTPPGRRFEAGTPPFEALAGVVAAVDYLASLGAGDSRPQRLDDAYARITAYEQELSRYVLHRLAQLPRVRLYGIADPDRAAERTPTFCLRVAGASPRETAAALGAGGVCVFDGDYYALEVMRALGLAESGGAVRASALHYTTIGELDRLLDGLATI